MSSLFGTLSISLRALLAQQAALQTTSENISNIDTPGYARRRVVMTEQTPVVEAGVVAGNGVFVSGIESLRDRVLELRLHEETQEQGQLQGFLGPMKQVETLFSSVDAGIGSNLDSFFNAVTRLSTDPTNMPLRQSVLTTAQNVACSFSDTARSLRSLQENIDRGIVQSVSQINQLSCQIAATNAEITRLQNGGGDTNAYEDQRTQLIRQLSHLTDLSIVDSTDGINVTAANGAPLVVGTASFTLETEPSETGAQQVFANGANITAKITGGELGGLIRARDNSIAGVLDRVNTLAKSVATAVNSAHKQGFDLQGDPGSDLFADPTTTECAANMKVALCDPARLAASADGSSGDNGNLTVIGAVRDATVVAGASPLSYYAGLAADIGAQVAKAQSDQDSGELVLRQLQDQRGAISGVSLDEEAANLIRYQRAFEASARVISVVNDLTETVLALGRN